jgi:hypothetical protein
MFYSYLERNLLPPSFQCLKLSCLEQVYYQSFFLWVWRSVRASGRGLFENIAGIKNSRKLLVSLPRPELVHSLHIELNLFLLVMLSLFVAKTM